MAAMRARARLVTMMLAVALAAFLILLAGSSETSFVSTTGTQSNPAERVPAGSLRGRQNQFQNLDSEAIPSANESSSNAAMGSIAALAMAAALMLGASSPAKAFFGTGNTGEVVGEIQASGLVFKDTINVERITDPKVSGVTLYQTDFSKSSFEKLQSGNLMQSDPSASGLACNVDGKVLAKRDISKDKTGEDVYSESKGFMGKTLKVKRIFDEKSNNVVYVVFTERMNKDDDPNGSRFKSQACSVHLDGFQ